MCFTIEEFKVFLTSDLTGGHEGLHFACMSTLPDYPGVSRIEGESPGLPYGSHNLPDKIDFWLF